MKLKKAMVSEGAMLGYQVSDAAVPLFGGLVPYMPLNSEFSRGWNPRGKAASPNSIDFQVDTFAVSFREGFWIPVQAPGVSYWSALGSK